MRVAFDTNVILDAILRREGSEAAQKLMYEVAHDRINGLITANTITDIYYIARKAIGDVGARVAINALLATFEIGVIDGEVCATALTTPMKDFEDAVMAVCASINGADYIVTRDEEFLAAHGSPVAVIAPSKLWKMLSE